ncbi:hypothetical protein JTB14_026979 [Gonioctena quinquepunctata]|nr:hypothetical protein JTB14_026979 [Gonioctena quinquepunctata]
MSGPNRSPQSHDRDKSPENPKTDPPVALNYSKAAQTTYYPKFAPQKIILTDSTNEKEYTGSETRSRRLSNTSSTSSLQSISKLVESVNQNIPNIPKINVIYTDIINLRNLPEKITQQRDAYRFLSRREVAGKNFLKVRTYYNRTGVLELKERVDLAEMRKRIRHVSGCPSIEVTNFHQAKKTPPAKATPPQNGPSLSYVVRDVDKLYTDEDLTEHFEETDLSFTKCWRMFSRARGEPTKMIRVITHDPNSYSDKIARGIFIYGRVHKCEPSVTAQKSSRNPSTNSPNSAHKATPSPRPTQFNENSHGIRDAHVYELDAHRSWHSSTHK